MIKYLEKDNFEEEINKDFILVDFYADWCGPCKRMGTILENINDYEILKVNVDSFPDIAKEYQVMSIPTMIIFKKGQVVAKHIGILEEENLKAWLKENN